MHWSRWGDPDRVRPLPEALRGLLQKRFGTGDVSFTVPLGAVRLPDSDLPGGFLPALVDIVGAASVTTDAEARVRHTGGKSTPDLIRLRSGDGSAAPDAIVTPGSHEQVHEIITLCSQHRVALIPFGGGTSVVGGLRADRGRFEGVVALDLARLTELISVDPISQTAQLGAGLLGPAAEALLEPHGFMIGHYPQSFEYASIGGFAATRSSGQASAGYGRFDAMVVGLRVATGIGTLTLGTAPASAAGPDLRELILGSEGAFGVITSVTVRVRPLPEARVYAGWRFSSFEAGASALRSLAQAGPMPTVLRLSDEAETAVGLSAPGEVTTHNGCLLIVGHEGSAEQVATTAPAVAARLRALGGSISDDSAGEHWRAGRFQAPYLRDALLDEGLLVETVETATFWANLPRVYAAARGTLAESLTAPGAPALVLCHISHVYPTGAALYFTVVARPTGDPLQCWATAKAAVSTAIVTAGGTITHHHAIGRDHKPWLAADIGEVGIEILRGVKARLDPAGILNPGVLIP